MEEFGKMVLVIWIWLKLRTIRKDLRRNFEGSKHLEGTEEELGNQQVLEYVHWIIKC